MKCKNSEGIKEETIQDEGKSLWLKETRMEKKVAR